MSSLKLVLGFPGCGLAKYRSMDAGNMESSRALDNKQMPPYSPRQATKADFGQTHYVAGVSTITFVNTIFVGISTPISLSCPG
jgi:hypothetical protein